MFCRNCGRKLEENESICNNCFTEINSSNTIDTDENKDGYNNSSTLNMDKSNGVRREIPNNSVMYIIFSAIESVMCCQPLGIISLVFSVLAYDAFKYGDEERGKKHLKVSKILLIIGISLFVLFIIFYVVIIFTSIAFGSTAPMDYNNYNL